ncbi:MAG: helix-turn-helix domain-containing protein [Alphaproteobacteria bacterium]
MKNTNKNIKEIKISTEHKSKLYNLIGNRIKSKRIELGMTEEELAKKLSISVKDIKNIENGSQKFTVDFLAQMAYTLDINKVYLLTGVDDEILKEDIQLLDSYIEFFKMLQSLSDKNKERLLNMFDKKITPNVKKCLKNK